MQEVLSLTPSKQVFTLSFAAWAVLALTTPSRVANYDFRHFDPADSLTISFSRSSPPLAILEDEHLIVARAAEVSAPASAPPSAPATVPVAKIQAPSAPLGVDAPIIQRSMPVAQIRRATFTRRLSLRPSPKSTSSLQSLLGLVQSVKDPNIRQKRLINPLMSEVRRYVAVNKIVGLTGGNTNQRATLAPLPMNVREHVEEPLTAPSVPRGLPWGEDVTPVVIPQDHVSTTDEPQAAAHLHVIKALAEDSIEGDGQSLEVTTSLPPSPSTKSGLVPGANRTPASWTTAMVNNRSIMTPSQPTSQSPANVQGQVDREQRPAAFAMDGGDATNPFTVVGQVELTGGLAATGYSTKLNIQWKTGSQTRDAAVDYSTGHFVIQVPTLDAGKVVATLVDDSGRTLGWGDFDLDGVAAPGQKTLEGADIIIEAQSTAIKGQVRSAYSVDSAVVPVTGAEIFGPAQSRETADDKGNFKLSGVNSDSTLLLDSYATDYWGTRVIAAGGLAPKIPLFSNKMIESLLDILGQSNGSTEEGIVWGVIRHKGNPVKGVQVGISEAGAIGPIYFNELRIPDKNLTATSSNGLYAFVKVRPGLDVVEAGYNSKELPSTVVSVSSGMVAYSEISFKSLEVTGRVYDPVVGQNLSAKVSVVGASTTTQSTPAAQGFDFQIPSSDPVIFVEADAGPAYMVSREAIPRREAHEVNLMAYKKDWIAKQFQQINSKYNGAKGLLLGYVEGGAFSVRLDDTANPQDSAEDADPTVVYFDSNGVPDSSLVEGQDGGGVFMMTNLKPGLHTLVITASTGEMTASRIFVAQAGVLNVLSMPLRP